MAKDKTETTYANLLPWVRYCGTAAYCAYFYGVLSWLDQITCDSIAITRFPAIELASMEIECAIQHASMTCPSRLRALDHTFIPSLSWGFVVWGYGNQRTYRCNNLYLPAVEPLHQPNTVRRVIDVPVLRMPHGAAVPHSPFYPCNQAWHWQVIDSTVPTHDQILVPESLLKKRKSHEKARNERAAAIEKKKAVSWFGISFSNKSVMIISTTSTRLLSMLSYC